MAQSTLVNNVSITHIGTATAILEIDGIAFLTDPFFSPAGSEWPTAPNRPPLKVYDDPALNRDELPHIDAVLLSHENHPDNLDELGRQLLDGRHVLTTIDGAKNLAPRPSVHGFKNWEEKQIRISGSIFTIIATPCKHWPGQECVGFLLHTETFGTAPDGRRNVVYFSGDTVYVEELAKISENYHVTVALMNLGKATFFEVNSEGEVTGRPEDSLQITMDGRQAARLFRDLKADVLVPMHYESWDHFTQHQEELAKEFQDADILSSVRWLRPGKAVKVY